MPTDSNDPHPGEESKHDVQAKKEFSNLLFFFSLRQPAGWMMLRGEGVVFYSSFPQTSPYTSVCYITSTQEEGQTLRVLPEGAFLCWTGSLHSGVGMAGLEIAGWPVLSAAPKEGMFQLAEIKVFLYS